MAAPNVGGGAAARSVSNVRPSAWRCSFDNPPSAQLAPLSMGPSAAWLACTSSSRPRDPQLCAAGHLCLPAQHSMPCALLDPARRQRAARAPQAAPPTPASSKHPDPAYTRACVASGLLLLLQRPRAVSAVDCPGKAARPVIGGRHCRRHPGRCRLAARPRGVPAHTALGRPRCPPGPGARSVPRPAFGGPNDVHLCPCALCRDAAAGPARHRGPAE